MSKRQRDPSKKKGKRRGPAPVKPVVLANNVDPRPVKKRSPKGKRSAGINHVRAVCSITDPFCPAAKNSKWPDGTCGNTLTEQFRGSTIIASSANGNTLMCFAPGAPFGVYGSTTVSTTQCTTVAAAVSYRSGSLLATFGGNYRIVSFGVIVRCIASATSASGIVTFGTGKPLAFSTTYTLGTELYDEVSLKAIQPGLEYSWISQPRGTGARDFTAQTDSAFATPPMDWSALIIEVSGAPNATNMLQAEWFLNVEFEAKPGNQSITAIAKPNPPKSTAAESAVSAVHSSLGSLVEGGVKQVEAAIADHASAALSNLMSDPLESLASLFAMF